MNARQELALRDKRHLVPDLAFQPPESAYGYEAALWATGCKVQAYETFGDYQGRWWARLQFPNGEIYYVTDYYGSCSGCDAFEAEFDWNSRDDANYLHRLKDFGREYLTDCMTLEQAVEKAGENASWDNEAEQMVDWIIQSANISIVDVRPLLEQKP